MNGLQVALLFALWVGLGFFLKGQNEVIRQRLIKKSKNTLIGIGIGTFLIAVVVLFLSLALVGQNPSLYSKGQMSFLGFVFVAIGGGLFVFLQVIGAASMILIAIESVTNSSSQTSQPLETSKLSSDSCELDSNLAQEVESKDKIN